MEYFKLELKLAQLTILLALVKSRPKLVRGWLKKQPSFSLRELSRITHLDFRHSLHRYKDWLLNERILIEIENSKYAVNFDMIAYLLFTKYNTSPLYDFAFDYLDKPPKPPSN